MPLKIVLVITGLGMGGAERQVCDLADEFAEEGHQVLLISMTEDKVNLPKNTKINVLHLNMDKTPLGIIRCYLHARRVIRNFKPDVVHSHMVHANIFARMLRLSISIPRLICTAHSSNEGGRLRMLAYRFTDHLCDISTNVSQEAVDAFFAQGAVGKGRMLAIHNGIDTERFTFDINNRTRFRAELNINEGIPLLLAVGRLNVAKDYPNLLLAFQHIIKSGRLAHLVIIGIGEEEAKLITIVAELGLCDKVHFLGMRHDVHKWMSAADIFVLSSAWEGFGLVVAEAMACERLVVATDCGGVREVVANCGLLVPPRNSVMLANALAESLSLTDEQAEEQGIAARQRIVEQYSLKNQVEKWLRLYQ